MLRADDFDGDETNAVWVQRTIRILEPVDPNRREMGIPWRSTVEMLSDNSADTSPWTVDESSSCLLGVPVVCSHCRETVAIRYGETYVWGRREYGTRDEKHVVPGQYCPSCDGGEDQP